MANSTNIVIALPAGMPATARSAADRRNLIVGVVSGLLVVLCWAGWVVATRFAVTTQLRPVDVAFLRYLAPAVVLLPVLVRRGFGPRQIGVARTAMLVAGAGLPFLLVASTGMKFAPASDVGTVMVGTMPVFVAVFSALVSRERFDRIRVFGFLLVVLGIAGIAAHGLFDFHSGAWRGHLLFLAGGAMYAAFTVTFRRSGIGPWHAAAIVNFYSLLLIAPVYFLVCGPRVLSAPPGEVVTQAFMQGVVAGIMALYFYGDAIRRLGASRAAVLGALTPVVVALVGVPLLGEIPNAVAWAAIFAVSAGVVLASHGSLAQARRR
ncbi:MAG: DMT family transporter [Stellaceae bacterium]